MINRLALKSIYIFPGPRYGNEKSSTRIRITVLIQRMFLWIRSTSRGFYFPKTIKCNFPFPSLQCHLTDNFVKQFVPANFVKGALNAVQKF